jgi:hypothetical protein
MKNTLLLWIIFALIFLPACDGWVYVVPTFPAPPPTITPSIYTPTPVFLTATYTPTADLTTVTATHTTVSPPTETATALSETPTVSATSASLPANSPIPAKIEVEILGCNTSLDITHGMGEVTNAFVILKNASGSDLPNLCATLFALDEGRIHPDKTVCLPALAHGFQSTLKLTVDSTYKQDTPVQVEVKSGETLLVHVGQPSCKDIGLFAPVPASLLTPLAIP